MKKILLVLSVFACFQAVAQQKQTISVTSNVDGRGLIHTPDSDLRSFENDHKKRGGTQYYNWRASMANFEGIGATQLNNSTFVYSMFPDSNVRFGPPNTQYGILYQSIGEVFHPQSDIYNFGLAAGEYPIGANAFSVDSVYVRGSYNKLTSAVDTLIVSVAHSGGDNLPTFYFSGQTADFGVDTTRFALMEYNPANWNKDAYQTQRGTGPAPTVIKYPLTNSDSSSYTPGANSFGIKTIGVPVNLNVPAGEIAAVSFTFKPGYSYNVGDSMRNNNFFMFRSSEPKGDNTFMPFYPGDFNMSAIVQKDTGGWSGNYIPTIAFTNTYAPEVHDIVWQITCPDCQPDATDDIAKEFEQINIFPNPAQNDLNIELTEVKTNNVNVTVYSMTGKKLITAVVAQGNSKVSLDIATLPAGIYVCELESNGLKQSTKITKK